MINKEKALKASLNKKRGDFGENQACFKLEESGYNIVRRNYRRKGGEIDIIAENDKFLIFAEVKTRKENSMISGFSAIDIKKQTNIIQTAQLYLIENPTDKAVRFDAVQVVIRENHLNQFQTVSIDYIENAFEANGKERYLFL